MAQNIYDDPDFFKGYSSLPRSLHGLQGAPEWPSIAALLPQVRDKTVADLGCGFGWFCRWAAQAGAAAVSGYDLSENMIARARQESTGMPITYTVADMAELAMPADTFDLVYSSLAFHYVEDFSRLLGAIRQGLRSGGHLVFSIEHPIYMAPAEPAWIWQAGRKTWPVNQYFFEGRRITNWLADGVVKYHRTLGTTLNQLIEHGFRVDHVLEWQPSRQQREQGAVSEEEMARPMFLIVKASL